ncbi:MAG: class I SAM-dependent methyltransferase [bacterium]|nr:class I SAM-dependent methyltransferase [bacterium]
MNQYDKIGKKYLNGQKTFFSKNRDESFEFIRNTITKLDFKNKKILDVGCGDGRYMERLEKLGARYVYGLDESRVMLEEAKHRGINSKKLFYSSIEKSELPSNSFDIIYARFSLQHLKNLDQMYKEVSRLLKKGGALIFAVPHPIRDLMLVKSQEYKSGQSFIIKLFKKKVSVVANMHPFDEYLSPTFFRLFKLAAFAESTKSEMYLKGFKVPEFLGIVASKL